MLNVYSSTHDRKEGRLTRIGGKIVGRIEGKRFVKTVIGSKHMLLRPVGWALDADSFDKEIKPNTNELVIIDRESAREYWVTTETFDRLKGELDRGHGRQYFLTLNHWEASNSRHHSNALRGESDA